MTLRPAWNREYLYTTVLLYASMLARLSQLSQQIARPRLYYTRSATLGIRPVTGSSIMTSSAEERTHRMIHTAACLIIGDEVLGGKVRLPEVDYYLRKQLNYDLLDCRYKLRPFRQILLFTWH